MAAYPVPRKRSVGTCRNPIEGPACREHHVIHVFSAAAVDGPGGLATTGVQWEVAALSTTTGTAGVMAARAFAGRNAMIENNFMSFAGIDWGFAAVSLYAAPARH